MERCPDFLPYSGRLTGWRRKGLRIRVVDIHKGVLFETELVVIRHLLDCVESGLPAPGEWGGLTWKEASHLLQLANINAALSRLIDDVNGVPREWGFGEREQVIRYHREITRAAE